MTQLLMESESTDVQIQRWLRGTEMVEEQFKRNFSWLGSTLKITDMKLLATLGNLLCKEYSQKSEDPTFWGFRL